MVQDADSPMGSVETPGKGDERRQIDRVDGVKSPRYA